MIKQSSILISSLLLAAGLVFTASAEQPAKPALQKTEMQAPQRQGMKLAQPTPNKQQIRSQYKKTRWQRNQRQLKLEGPGGPAAIPETDCPPLPTKACLDTWDVKAR